MYIVDFTEKAKDGLKKLSSTPKYIEKVDKLIEEIKVNPKTGIGKPEQLRNYDIPTWSRHISEKHRLVYEIHENIVTVLVLTTYGHYNDK